MDLGAGQVDADARRQRSMIRECRAGDVERIHMLDDITAEVILEEAVWRIAGRDGQLERRGCSSFLRQQ